MNDKVFVCAAMAFLPWFGWLAHSRLDAGKSISLDLFMIAAAWICIVVHVIGIGRGSSRRP